MLLPLAVALLASAGCNRSGLFKATGRLTYKGQPVPSTYLTFHPDDKHKRPSHALTDDDGNFTVTNSRTEVGIVPGRHTVSLRYYPSNEEELGQAPPKASKQLKAVIARYGDADKSPLHVEVSQGGQNLQIDLE
ncbi:MAG TPA: hypothetical protein VFE78_11535 [Gemmataceae bacterium]|nr:hypothetical protein [Gemmataceae bacterium]